MVRSDLIYDVCSSVLGRAVQLYMCVYVGACMWKACGYSGTVAYACICRCMRVEGVWVQRYSCVLKLSNIVGLVMRCSLSVG